MATNIIVARGGVEYVPPLSLAFWRWLTVFLILLPFFLGEILEKKTGTGGFGYDPIFKPTEASASFAEMNSEEKNKISHRGIAIQKLVDFLLNL